MKKNNGGVFFAILFLILIITIPIVTKYYTNEWVVIHKEEFNKFFGENNWTYEKLKDKIDDNLKTYKAGSNNGRSYKKVGGDYQRWLIYTSNGDECYISNATHKYNHKKRTFLNKDWRTSKESLWYEFLEVSLEKASEEYYEELLKNYALYNIADLNIGLGNIPSPKFLKYLQKSNWLTYEKATYEYFLTCTEEDFELDITCKIPKEDKEKWDLYYKEIIEIENYLVENYKEKLDLELTLLIEDTEVEDWYMVEYENGKRNQKH